MDLNKGNLFSHRSGGCCCCSVAKLCPTLCDPMDCNTPGFPVLHCLLELAQTHVHWVSDAIPPSHPLLSPSPPAFNLSQHQGLFQWVSSLHQVTKVLQLQHQSFQWIFRVDLLEDRLVWSCSPESSPVQKHQFVGTQPSLCSNSHIFTWLLGWKSKVKVLAKPWFLCRPSLPLFNFLVVAGDPWYSLACAISL